MVNSIENQLKEHFQSKGIHLLDNPDLEDGVGTIKPDLILADGEYRVYVKIISDEILNERNALLNSILKSVGFTTMSNMVYVVIPKLYASILDGKIFHENGLGLMTYDDKGLFQEIIKPKIFQYEQRVVHQELPEELLKEMNGLKDRLFLLENEVSALRDKLKAIRTNQDNVEIKPQIRKVEVKQDIGQDNYPEFMKDNPWMEILSKRGKE